MVKVIFDMSIQIYIFVSCDYSQAASSLLEVSRDDFNRRCYSLPCLLLKYTHMSMYVFIAACTLSSYCFVKGLCC